MSKEQIKKGLSELNGAELNAPLVTGDQTIDPVLAAENLDKLAADEKFMSETVEVMLAETTNENDPDHIVLNVNGVNQPVFRGVWTKMRRCFVEVLARCKETKYTQIQDKYELDRSELRARTAHAYPFQVIDRNPRGGAWLKAVMAEAA